MISGRLVNLIGSGVFLATVSLVASGCHDHLYDFGVGVIPSDAAVVDGPARTDVRVNTPDAHHGGAGGNQGGSGGAGGTSATGGVGGAGGGAGGVQTCNPDSPDLQVDISHCRSEE